MKKILIANRGEIALRIIRTAREMGIRTVAIHSSADDTAMHVLQADESVCIGPPAVDKSYLNIPAIVSACEVTQADMVHPGYGFLSENARFVEILHAHNIGFIGPNSEHIASMGDKIAAKDIAKELGLPVVPGSDGEIDSLDKAQKQAQKIGYPVLLKAAAGGGGRGMKIVRKVSELANALAAARQEAKAAFGDDTVYMEKYLQAPRHIEIQVLCDKHGNCVHLGERDCSLQRRHQKIFEETLSTVLTDRQRRRIGDIVTKAMKKLGYIGVGTVEFLFEDNNFYFIEMNTRLQVEHPVTEEITGIDLVRAQICVARGEKLKFSQDDIRFNGHAIECRINAENAKNFTPSVGKITDYYPPGGMGVRMDSALYRNYRIPAYYDSLIGKLVIHADTRTACLQRLTRALNEIVIEGVETTIPLFQTLLNDKDFCQANYHIHWLEEFLYKA